MMADPSVVPTSGGFGLMAAAVVNRAATAPPTARVPATRAGGARRHRAVVSPASGDAKGLIVETKKYGKSPYGAIE